MKFKRDEQCCKKFWRSNDQFDTILIELDLYNTELNF